VKHAALYVNLLFVDRLGWHIFGEEPRFMV